MLSGGEGSASLRVARLIHGDPSPEGPGYRDEAVDWGAPATVQLEERVLELGSYVEIPASNSLNPSGAFSLAIWIYPTVLSGGWHAVAAKAAADDFGYALYCAGQNFVTRLSRATDELSNGSPVPRSSKRACGSWLSSRTTRTTATPAFIR